MASRTGKRAYKYRFYPDEQQKDLLLRTFGNKQSNYPKFRARKKSRRSVEFTASAFHWNGEPQSFTLAKTTAPLNIVW